MKQEVGYTKTIKIEYNKIMINIPVKLLKRFDAWCESTHRSRAEGIKHIMRIVTVLATMLRANPIPLHRLNLEDGPY